MVDKKMTLLFDGVNSKAKEVKDSDLIDRKGSSAARAVLKLMNKVYKNLPPEEICESFSRHKRRGRFDRMWEELGPKTVRNIADGCYTLAVLWQSAWVAGDGDNRFKKADLVAIDEQVLRRLYNDRNFVPSFTMKNSRFKDLLV